ncbi:MAG: BamA/TamA family outer membrane protein [Syntrophothermus sp.]
MSQNLVKNDSIIFVEKAIKRIKKDINFAVVPGPVFGTTEKLGFAVLPMVVYNLKKSDTLSPPSSSALLLYFDLHGSWATAIKQSLYWNENKWRAFGTIGIGDFQLRYFGIGRDTVIINNNKANFVWIHQQQFMFSGLIFRKIYKGFYGGFELSYSISNLVGTDSISNSILYATNPSAGKLIQTVLVPSFVWDNRDNIFWSTKGYYANLTLQFSNKFLFFSKDYSVITGQVNGYHCLLPQSKRLTLAWTFFFQAGWGNLPYRIYANYGVADNAKGYTAGKYVDYSETTVQTEFRYDLWKFIAISGYVGTGKVFPSYDVFGQSVWLHFTGMRFYVNIIPYRNIRLKLDFTKGRKDYGIYVGIGQGF